MCSVTHANQRSQNCIQIPRHELPFAQYTLHKATFFTQLQFPYLKTLTAVTSSPYLCSAVNLKWSSFHKAILSRISLVLHSRNCNFLKMPLPPHIPPNLSCHSASQYLLLRNTSQFIGCTTFYVYIFWA